MDDDMADAMIEARRSVCCDSTCGGLRMVGKKRCERCKQNTRCRPPIVGDMLVGSAFSGVAPASMMDIAAADAPDDAHAAEATRR